MNASDVLQTGECRLVAETNGAERRIGYKALRHGGLSPSEARTLIKQADEYFQSIGVTSTTPTRIPGNR